MNLNGRQVEELPAISPYDEFHNVMRLFYSINNLFFQLVVVWNPNSLITGFKHSSL